MEEVSLDEEPTPVPAIHISQTHAPIITMNGFEIMKLLQAAYKSEEPQITLEAFLLDYSISAKQLEEFIACVLWQTAGRGKAHPLYMINQMLKDTHTALHCMQPETIKMQFILYATMLPHIWVTDGQIGKVVHLNPKYEPVFYKLTNCKMPHVWICPNNFGMPCIVTSHQPIPFTVLLTRKEERGPMLPLEVSFFDGLGVKLEMEVDMDSPEGFSLTKVYKDENIPDFMLIMTRGMRYLRCILIQPSDGSFLLYPVCVHKI